MAYIILAFALILGAFADAKGLATLALQQNIYDEPSNASQQWLDYRSAVQFYVERHSDFSGSLELSDVGLDEEQKFLPNVGNYVFKDSSGTTIITWMALSSNIIADTIRLADGDRSIGISHGTSWTSPFFGNMGNLPVSVPEGDIISVVTFTGPRF